MEDLTLVVMAAGMGSRFGGLKQITPVDEYGNFIIDYSIFDAIEAGFNHVVFVIKEENYLDFKNTIGKRISDKVRVDYAFQNVASAPISKDIISKREKPWGTVQAILASRSFVKGNFAVINADDYYGKDSYKRIVDFFCEGKGKNSYVSVLFPFCETQINKEAVKRGVCTFKDDLITSIIECSIKEEDNKVIASPLDGDEPFKINASALVSMNIFGFTKDFYNLLEEYFKDFCKQSEEKILSSECLLPDCLEYYINKGSIKVYNRPSSSTWLGMTYKEDLDYVKEKLEKLTKEGFYKKGLW